MNQHNMQSNTDIEASAVALSRLWPELQATAERARVRAPILDVSLDGPRYWSLRVGRPEGFEAPAPGQYTTLGLLGVAPRYLVVAHADADSWSFLIDRDSTLGRALGAHASGDLALLSGPEGPGWDLDALTRPSRVIAFATGSGVATLMPALDLLATRHPERLSDVSLYYGETEPGDFAYAGTLDALATRGLTLRRTWSNRDAADPGPRFVQHALDTDAHDLRGATALLAGAPVMIQHVCAHLLRLGVPLDRIHTNMRD